MKKFAFTLPEILITLGIIGIVAVLTLSIAIPNLKRVKTLSKLKKFNYTMSQLIISSTEDNGPVNTWNIGLPYETFYKTYFTPYMKYSKINNNEIYFVDGTTMTTYSFFPNGCMDLLFDTNGKKKPNIEGRDRFRYLICPKKVKQYCGDIGFCTYRANKDKKNRKALLNCCKTRCGTSVGLTCTGLLEYDNWEFKKDYPYN